MKASAKQRTTLRLPNIIKLKHLGTNVIDRPSTPPSAPRQHFSIPGPAFCLRQSTISVSFLIPAGMAQVKTLPTSNKKQLRSNEQPKDGKPKSKSEDLLQLNGPKRKRSARLTYWPNRPGPPVVEVQVGLALQVEGRAHQLPHHMSRWAAQQIVRPGLNVARLQREGRTLVLVEEARGEAVEGVDEQLPMPSSQSLHLPKV